MYLNVDILTLILLFFFPLIIYSIIHIFSSRYSLQIFSAVMCAGDFFLICNLTIGDLSIHSWKNVAIAVISIRETCSIIVLKIYKKLSENYG